MMFVVNLNYRASQIVDRLIAQREELRIELHHRTDGGITLDFGIEARAGLHAGTELATTCLAGLATVSLVPAESSPASSEVQVVTDYPVAACLASQYAGWQIALGKYFAMGSGPMRAAAGNEKLFETIPYRESAPSVVGILETRKFPPAEVVAYLAENCRVSPEHVTLLVAPTASQAGNVQIVARSIETALHKMHELGFDLSAVISGYGRAPLPPVAADDLIGIGRTNDAILYGARVTLWMSGDDKLFASLGPKIPSNASPSFGQTFATLFEQAGHDFYKIDPQLFSPAVITLINVESGHTFQFGALAPEVLAQSFGA